MTSRPAASEPAGGDEAVAAVVAGAGDDEHRAVGDERGGGLGDRAAGGLHQRHAGGAGGDGERVGLGHLGGGQELVHSAAWPAPAGCAGIRDVLQIDDAGEAAGAGDADEAASSAAWTVSRSAASEVATSAVRAGAIDLGDPAVRAEVAQAAQDARPG